MSKREDKTQRNIRHSQTKNTRSLSVRKIIKYSVIILGLFLIIYGVYGLITYFFK
jgi:hypothetical protein